MNRRSAGSARTSPCPIILSTLVRTALLARVRAAWLVVAAAILNSALLAGALAAPAITVACSCAGPPLGAPIFDGQEDAVLVGRVGADDGSGVYSFVVERWFKGGQAASVRLASGTLRQADGTFAGNSCGVDLNPGAHLVVAAYRSDGLLTPSACSPLATVETGDGQAMLAAAARTFGPGLIPGGPPPTAPERNPPIDLALISIVGVVLVLVIVIVAIALAVGRREPPAAPER
jgi:hypothetical protein